MLFSPFHHPELDFPLYLLPGEIVGGGQPQAVAVRGQLAGSDLQVLGESGLRVALVQGQAELLQPTIANN